ncbi:uroporphyrinogen-III synthase /uroporphyrinogen-III C-methyltransferase [Fibrobacter sp. UWCM]|uniref:uroporphyrinogen-III C-methyltransferase n=1 Tax=Fibrobacter sp. UWCM TaxID=1896208 RepID=UPI0009185599|nr:uroporphyrinogen-III C-methyltransferase [Fibrobacter sp. UWCM]SHH68783.1 uroporphyrinogen-III synthase /uroporphyrinogen-III C-methyltransferase [Fibrobacter sp. UWCM]
MKGTVYLIGAGPGDPGLLTLRGKEILEKADVVVYDRLVSPAILGMCNPKAKMVDVGKMPTHHKVKQSEINRLLVQFACEFPGGVIARLKGGDPFVFGRGGEEALELVSAGVEFEVVPGITSAISVPAYAGIPVSHRGIATSFHIITGHEKADGRTCHPERSEAESKDPGQNLSLDFETLAKCPGTLIFLMGVANMDFIARRLMECGKDPKTPLAFIEKGTTPYQRTVMATLETAGETIARENVTAPAITIMGGVVELGQTLAWKKNLPLAGKRLVVTRAAKQASGITARLTALGAEVIETPMIETRDVIPATSSVIPAVILEGQSPDRITGISSADFNALANFDILVFTSTNGVESFFRQLFAAGYDVRVLAGKKIASVGKITEKKLLEYGIRCDYVPEDHTGEGLGRLLASLLVDHSRILLLQGNLADDTLLKLLPQATRWVVYETLPVAELPEWKREAVVGADAVVFASTSAVENFCSVILSYTTLGASPLSGSYALWVGERSSESKDLNRESLTTPASCFPRLAFCIGRMTESAARKHGFETVTSDETTMDSLVKKIVEHYKKES